MIGQTISHYHITAQLGEGGMGIIYRADDLKLDRQVAIKVLPPRLSQHPEARVRLLREAKAASALQHPNICTIHEIDDTEDGQLFMVMPCYEGETLRERLDRGPMSVEEALEFGRQVSSALAATHEKGIVHRDLKPGNIMLTNGGTQAVLMDFGLARPDEATQLTRTGATVGTIAYMSPEQVQGERADERSDLWSLGVVLYEMTTGRRPFEGDGEVPVLESILHKDPEPASSVNEELSPAFAAMLDRLLAKDPAKREAEASLVQGQIQDHAQALADPALRPDAPLGWRLRHWTRLHRGLLRGAAILVVLLLAAGAWYLWPSNAPHINSIAVLPFTDLSESGDQDWFCDGMTETLIQSLGEVGVPGVISRTSVQRFKRSELSVTEIAHELDADVLVEASVLRVDEVVRITARLLRGDTEEQLWSESFQRDLKDVLRMHAEVAELIAERVRVAIDPSVRIRAENRRVVDPQAYLVFLRGKHALYSGIHATNDSTGWEGIREKFEQAISIDPNCAEAWAGLAEWYVASLHEDYDAKEMIPAARAALSRAFEIDPDLQPAYVTQAHLLWEHEWKQAEAQLAFDRALELNPSDPYALILYSYYKMANRHFDVAADVMLRACALDPFNRISFSVAGSPLRRAGRFDDALRILGLYAERFGDVQPSEIYVRAMTYAEMGRVNDAVAVMNDHPQWNTWKPLKNYLLLMDRDEARAIGGLAAEQAIADGSELPALDLAYAHAILGDREQTLRSLAQHGEVEDGEAMQAAISYLMVDEIDQCFAYLEVAYNAREIWLPRINCRPYWYYTLHEDPRFQSLIERMGLSS